MKNGIKFVLSISCLTASICMAQTSVPVQDSYENYDIGSNLVGTVWQGTAGTSLAIVTNGTPPEPSVGYPIPSASHDKVMGFAEGPITNEFDGSTVGQTVIAVDTMILPTFAEVPTETQMMSVSNSQVSLYVDTNGFITVFHGVVNDTVKEGNQPDTLNWTTLNQGVSNMDTGTWFRLTVTLKYVTTGDSAMWFSIAKDGVTLTNSAGLADTSFYASAGGPWFIGAKWSELRMRRIVLSGSGMLDDTVVVTNEITFNPTAGSAYATNGVEIAWMVASGLSTNSTNTTWDAVALADEDGDGAPTWSEYYAGTQPTNPASKLVIVSLTYSNSFPVLKWIGTTNAKAPYAVQWSSNLMSVMNWTNAPISLSQDEGTNEVTLPAPESNPGFLRVIVNTNAP